MDLDEVHVKLTSDSSGFTEGIVKAISALTGLSAETIKVGSALTVMTAAAKLAADRLLESAVAAGKYSEELQHASVQTGVSAQTLQQYNVLLNRNKLDINDLAVGFRAFSRQVQEANDPTSKAARHFNELGISLSGDKSPDALLMKVADALKDLPDGFQKTSIATEFFSRAGMRLLPVLNEGSAAFIKSREDAERFGTVLSSDAVAKAAKFDDAMDDLHLAIQGFHNQVGALVAGPLTALIETMTAAIGVANNLTKALGEGNLAATLGGMLAGPQTQTPQPGALKTLPLPDKKTQDEMAESFGLPSAEYIGRTATNLTALFSKIRLLSEEEKGAAIETYTIWTGIAEKHAIENQQKQLGINLVHMTQTALKENSAEYEAEVMNGQDILKLQQEKIGYLVSGQWAQAEAVQLQIDEMNAVRHVDQAYQEKIKGSVDGERFLTANLIAEYNERRAPILLERAIRDENAAKAIEDTKAEMDLQEQYYKMEQGGLMAADAARQVAFAHEQALYDQRKARVEDSYRDQLISQEEYTRKSVNMELEHEASLAQIVSKFPSFYETQLQAMVSSNSFSLATITSNFSSATAKWIVEGTKFKQFWISLQETLVQAVINTGIQMVVQDLLLESKRSAVAAAGAATRVTEETTAATATTTVWTGAYTAITAAGTAALAGFEAITTAMVSTVISVGEFIVGILEGIAAALEATIFGIPVGIVVAAAAAGLAAFLAIQGNTFGAALSGAAGAGALALTFLAEGGVVTQPTLAMVGEGGGPEAVIPLDQYGGFGHQTIVIQVDGRELARNTMQYMPGLVYMRTGVR